MAGGETGSNETLRAQQDRAFCIGCGAAIPVGARFCRACGQPVADVSSAAADRQPQSALILTNAGFRAIADIGSKIATAALYLLVARKAGAGQFGIFAFAISFAAIAVTPGQFGQEFVLVREVSRDRGRLDDYYSSVLLSRVMLGVPPLLIALAVASVAGMNAETRLVILLMGAGFIGDALVQVSFAVFQAFERVGLTPGVLVPQRWLTTVFALLLLYRGAGIVGVAAVYCAGTAVAACMAAWLLYSRVARPRLTLNVRGALQVSRTAFPIGLGIVALALLSRVDMTMLAAFKPASQVGQYGAAYRLLDTTAFVTWSVCVAVLPAMSRLTPTSTPSVGSVYQRALQLVLAITLPLAVGAAILATPIVALLYGAQYKEAAGALVLLAPTITLFPVSALSSQLLYSQDVRRIVPLTYFVVFLENVVVNLILIPRYSLDGAAAGTSISEVLVAGTLLFCSRRIRGRLELRRLLSGTLLACCAAAAAMTLLHAHLALAVPVAIVVYLGLLLAYVRMAFPKDYDTFRAFLLKALGRQRGPDPNPSYNV
jgi:O-antigen/teichoic acid export membrane protein